MPKPISRGVRDAFIDRSEGAAAEEIRRVDDVPGGTQLLGEGGDARCQSERVMEEQYFGHDVPCLTRSDREVVEPRGLEPLTSTLPVSRSPN